MEKIISEELLSKVLGGEVISFEIKDNNVECFAKGLPFDIHINIYELADKCKEWAIRQGYFIDIFLSDSKPFSEVHKKGMIEVCMEAETEYQLIFDICEWILKESK